MRDAFLPSALLCVALGIALAYAPRRAVLPSAGLFAATAALVWWASPPRAWADAIFLGCWVSVLVTAALAFWQDLPAGVVAGAAVNAGVWAGGVPAVSGTGGDLMLALPFLLIAIAARLAARRGWVIAPRIAASWLIAVAALSAFVSLTPTPGYVPDHMD